MSLQAFGNAASGKTWHCTTYTANGTWTKNANAADLIIVDLVGGGQAGFNGGGAGSSGGTSGQRVCAVLNVNGVSSAAITIGAGGASNGAHGTESTFGSLLRAHGSNRITPYFTAGPGGPWGFTQIDDINFGKSGNTAGQPAAYHPGCAIGAVGVGGVTATNTGGGAGGGTFYGQGGSGGAGHATNGNPGGAASGYGSGGGGGGGGSSTGGAGSAGMPGLCKVWEYW
ncbi:MAG: hypothetical protein IT518_02755 [Burkholderiales bacterium]|nr:hypothetical protein [Burkholderiales bacterium]